MALLPHMQRGRRCMAERMRKLPRLVIHGSSAVGHTQYLSEDRHGTAQALST